MTHGFRKYRFLLALTVTLLSVRGRLLGNNYLVLIIGLPVIALLDFLFGKDRRDPASVLAVSSPTSSRLR